MKAEKRVELLHEKMEVRRRMRERQKTNALGALCAVFATGLFALLFKAGTTHNGGTSDIYSGSTMLFENAGGYVLIAVVSFAAAVVVTLLCIRWKNKKGTNQKKNNNEKNEQKVN